MLWPFRFPWYRTQVTKALGNKKIPPRIWCLPHGFGSEDTSAEESGSDNDEVDQELFLEAYTSFRNQSRTFRLRGSLSWFDGVERLPDSWPFARLSLSIDGLIFQMEKAATTFFLSGCCMAQRRSLSGRSPFCQLFKGLQ